MPFVLPPLQGKDDCIRKTYRGVDIVADLARSCPALSLQQVGAAPVEPGAARPWAALGGREQPWGSPHVCPPSSHCRAMVLGPPRLDISTTMTPHPSPPPPTGLPLVRAPAR